MDEHDRRSRGPSRLDIAVVAVIGLFAVGGFVYVIWSLGSWFSFRTG